jgi:hypothetical protein
LKKKKKETSSSLSVEQYWLRQCGTGSRTDTDRWDRTHVASWAFCSAEEEPRALCILSEPCSPLATPRAPIKGAETLTARGCPWSIWSEAFRRHRWKNNRKFYKRRNWTLFGS